MEVACGERSISSAARQWPVCKSLCGFRPERYRESMASTADSPASNAPKTQRTSMGQMSVGHLILLVFCVGLPVLFTAVAPLSTMHFSRNNGSVSVEVSKRLLFVIPFHRATVGDVQSVGDHHVSGTMERSWSGG